MSLLPGTRLGPYEVLGPLGAGGMGEVYRARDTRLNRDVAIKVLPEAFGFDIDRLARFRREAQLLAALNHPHIAAIHGLEETESVHALVMELVEGETLAERISRGPLPPEEALSVASQIAEALEAAHEKGIIHRDLKPANIKITPEGAVKVLDFGLAKAMEVEADVATGVDLAHSPTLSVAATQAGVILGTASYMSPEQAKGKTVDRRTDIWSFGLVLYEMLTGQQAFGGDDVSEILASILAREPDVERLPSATDLRIKRLLGRCLEKDPRRRLRDIGDALLELRDVLEQPGWKSSVTESSAASGISRWKLLLPWVAASSILALSLAALAAWLAWPEPPKPVMRFRLRLPVDAQLSSGTPPAVAFSPDGRRYAYVAQGQLYLRALDQPEAAPVPAAGSGVACPVFSPDGQWLAYGSLDGTIKKISVTGGAPITLCSGWPYGMSWEPDNTIVFSNSARVIQQVSGNGGEPKDLLSTQGRWLFMPQRVSGGTAVLHTRMRSGASPQVVVQSLEREAEAVVLVKEGGAGRLLPTGHFVYVTQGTLMAVRLDTDRMKPMGGPAPILEQVTTTGDGVMGHFSYSDNGSLIFLQGTSAVDRRRLVWVDRGGKEEPLNAPLRDYSQPRLSPDGTRVALHAEREIWLYDLLRGTNTKLSFNGGSRPAWTPDGKRIAYTGGDMNIHWMAADGSGSPEQLTSSEHMRHSNAWSPDGKKLIHHEHNPKNLADLWVLETDGGKFTSRLLLGTPFSEDGPVFSPDGRWLAYTSDASDREEVYVRAFEGNGERLQVSVSGGTQPIWARNGELFYREGDKMMAVRVETQPVLRAEKPRVLFEGPYADSGAGPFAGYDVTADGKRFLMVRPDEAEKPTLNLVLNWFEEIRSRTSHR